MFTKGFRLDWKVNGSNIFDTFRWKPEACVTSTYNLPIPSETSEFYPMYQTILSVGKAQKEADRTKNQYSYEAQKLERSRDQKPAGIFGILSAALSSSVSPERIDQLKEAWDAAEENLYLAAMQLDVYNQVDWGRFLSHVKDAQEARVYAYKKHQEESRRYAQESDESEVYEDCRYQTHGDGILKTMGKAMVAGTVANAAVTHAMLNRSSHSTSPSKLSYSDRYMQEQREKHRNEFVYGGGRYASPSQRAAAWDSIHKR